MLHYAVVFFVIALVAALFGFGGIAAGAAGIAKILFFAFLIIAIVTFLMSLARKESWRRPRAPPQSQEGVLYMPDDTNTNRSGGGSTAPQPFLTDIKAL